MVEKEEGVGWIHEPTLGKGIATSLKVLRSRGSFKDKKRSKVVGVGGDAAKEIHTHIERRDEYGRILTPKQAYRILSHKFHGKGPGKMKQEKHMQRYMEEMKMRNADAPSLSLERMREAQAKLQSPYLVLF